MFETKTPAGRRETKTVLFLCTGNYYRSRFAEEMFNHMAAEAGLDWQAVSRGIALELGLHNVGPMSTHALRGLASRGISARGARRFPAQLHSQELDQADRVIALKEAEHRPLLMARFPGWADRIEYWHVDDVEDTSPGEAVPAMERHVADLIRQLGAGRNGDGAE